LSATLEIENEARIVTIGVGAYWDITATKICDTIDWGALSPGESKTITVYLKNTGKAPITGSFNLTGWDPPEAANYLSLQWDFGEHPLSPSRIRKVSFTLTVSPDIHDITDFRFTIVVTGTQYVA